MASFQKGKLQVQSVYSHRSLGGMHFTNALVKHFADFVNKKYKIDVYKNKKSLLRLEKACDRLKLVLSANTEGQLSVECLQNDIDVHANMKREEFIQLVQPLLDQVLIPVKKGMPLFFLCFSLFFFLLVEHREGEEIHGQSIEGPAVQFTISHSHIHPWAVPNRAYQSAGCFFLTIRSFVTPLVSLISCHTRTLRPLSSI